MKTTRTRVLTEAWQVIFQSFGAWKTCLWALKPQKISACGRPLPSGRAASGVTKYWKPPRPEIRQKNLTSRLWWVKLQNKGRFSVLPWQPPLPGQPLENFWRLITSAQPFYLLVIDIKFIGHTSEQRLKRTPKWRSYTAWRSYPILR